MNCRSTLRFFVVTGAILGMVLGFGVFSGCDDDGTTPVDSKAGDISVDSPKIDQYVAPDIKTPDAYVWPDVKPVDSFVWPDGDTGYSGTPFGCQDDTDCFGQQCCPTPWGVKLCAPSCSQ